MSDDDVMVPDDRVIPFGPSLNRLVNLIMQQADHEIREAIREEARHMGPDVKADPQRRVFVLPDTTPVAPEADEGL